MAVSSDVVSRWYRQVLASRPPTSDEFNEFLQEKYQGGDATITHPDPELRKKHPEIKFWTAMKYTPFKAQVEREYEAWRRQKAEHAEQATKRPSPADETGTVRKKPEEAKVPYQEHATIGADITSPFQLREGDYLDYVEEFGIFKVERIEANGTVLMQQLLPDGTPKGPPRAFPKEKLEDGKFRRIRFDDPTGTEDKRLGLANVQNFADGELPYPLPGYDDYTGYREFLVMGLRGIDGSPFYHVRANSPGWDKMLEYVDMILESRGITKDWKRPFPTFPTFSATEDWQKKEDTLRKIAFEGDPIGRDIPLSEGDDDSGGINGGKKRRMKLGDQEHDFIYKAAADEQLARHGVAPGTLHFREQAAYAIDRLLGDGAITPPTVSSGIGSYQAWVDDAETWAEGDREGISTDDMFKHPDAQRLALLDVLTGNEDRHGNNVMFSWKNPEGPRTLDNLRLHAIDNGYSFGAPGVKPEIHHYEIRNPWADDKVLERLLSNVSMEMFDKLKAIDMDEFLKSLSSSGLTHKESLKAAAVRLTALQNNPDIFPALIGDLDSFEPLDDPYWSSRAKYNQATVAQQVFQHLSGHDPERLLNDYTKLDAEDALAELEKKVEKALSSRP